MWYCKLPTIGYTFEMMECNEIYSVVCIILCVWDLDFSLDISPLWILDILPPLEHLEFSAPLQVKILRLPCVRNDTQFWLKALHSWIIISLPPSTHPLPSHKLDKVLTKYGLESHVAWEHFFNLHSWVLEYGFPWILIQWHSALAGMSVVPYYWSFLCVKVEFVSAFGSKKGQIYLGGGGGGIYQFVDSYKLPPPPSNVF